MTVLWGALIFIHVLDQTGKTEVLGNWLKKFHPNRDLQVLLLSRGWVTVLEGISGFGSPPALVAPILVRMGVSKELAMLLPLYGNALAVPFGAMSTPLIIGFPHFQFQELARSVSQLSAGLSIITFFGVWILIRGGSLHRSKEEWFWLARALTGTMLGMLIAGTLAPLWSAAISGVGFLLFVIPWSRAGDVFDKRILFLVEMTAVLVIGQVLFHLNPGISVALGSGVIAFRSGKNVQFIGRMMLGVIPKLKKPFIVTTLMTGFILTLTQVMKTNAALFSSDEIQALWLGFIAPGFAGTATLGNLWVSSSFLNGAQLSTAACTAEI